MTDDQQHDMPTDEDMFGTDIENLTLDDYVTYRVSVLAQMFGREASRKYHANWGLTLPQYRVLTVLGKLGSMALRELTDQTQMDKGQISRVVTQLEAENYLIRQPDEHDGRRQILVLTKSGERLYRRTIGAAEARQREILSVLSPEELVTLRTALDKLSRHMRERLGSE